MWPFSKTKSEQAEIRMVELALAFEANTNLNQQPKFVATPPSPCKECGVLVTPSKLEAYTEVFLNINQVGVTDVSTVNTFYCSCCMPEAQLSLHLMGKEETIEETRYFTFVEGWIQDLDSEGKEQWLVSNEVYQGIMCEWCGEPTDSVYTFEGNRYCSNHETKKSRGG